MPWTSAPYREIQLLAAEWPDTPSVSRLPPLRLRELIDYVRSLQEKLTDAPREIRNLAKELENRLRDEQRTRGEHAPQAVATA